MEAHVKVLFVSDSLGAPIEQRGIHNFSMSFIEALQEIGAEVDLLVERPPSSWLPSRMRSTAVDLSVTKKSVAIAEVFRFFGRRTYNTGWISQAAERRFLPGIFLKLAGHAYVAFVRLWAGGKITVENNAALVDFVPSTAWHLTMPNRFVVKPAVYTEMVIRAAWGLRPDVVDASGYQLVVIDTPMYFKVTGIDPAKIISVVHDIIPLRDPMMTPYWRNLFWKKLEAVLKLYPNFAFVSEYSRSIFSTNFPKYKLRNSFILYPTLRNSTLRRAKAAAGASLTPYAPSGLNNLERSVAFQNDEDAKRTYENAMERRIAMGARYQRVAKVEDAYLQTGWDTRLPYFVTVVSDEPRKNIAIFIKAFTALRGRANMVVLGNVVGERYVGEDPDALGNIRFTGYIFENEKSRIIAKASGLIFPSYTEGFGIPITEGAVYGKPVLCSDIDVFREVAGDHAFYFDPYKDETLVEAVDAVVASPEESQKRAKALQARVLERFTVDANKRRVNAFLGEIGFVKSGA